ncbi:MAG: Gfo/Idh/MocA family oxidoreductase [Opitutaceae bacterium]|nr:Gfo/Idh/MocA family oxidoreductase [Opitutaceae bacterium]
MGATHAQAYSKIRNARVVAIFDTNRRSAAVIARRIGLRVPIYDDLDKALDAHPIDVIDLCLPTRFHSRYIRRALQARKHIFCEKPFAVDAREASSLAAAAERARVKMQIGLCTRFWPEYQALRALVCGRSAGRLLSLSLQRRCRRPPAKKIRLASSTGAALELHLHDTDFVHYLLGRPKAVTSVGTKEGAGWAHLFTTYHFDGIAVTAEGGWNYPPRWGFQMAFQAVFERGVVEFDNRAEPPLAITWQDGSKRSLPFVRPRIRRSRSGLGPISELDGYFNELAYFIGCLEHQRAPLMATPRQAVDSIRTVMAEIRSAESGRTIRLKR